MFWSVLSYQDNRTMMSSSEEELDLPVEMSMLDKINNLEKFSNLKEKNWKLEESMNDSMRSDMAALKAELSALRSRVEAQDQQIGEIKKKLEEKATSAPSHSEVQRKRPALHRIVLQSRRADLKTWTRSSSLSGLNNQSERQQAFFNYMMDQLNVKCENAPSLLTVIHKSIPSIEVMSHDNNN